MLPLRATPVVGLPQYEGWSQVSENPPTSFARLVCAFSVRGEQAGNIGRDIAAMIGERTLASGQELFGFLTELSEKVEAEGCQLACAAYMATKTSAVLGALRGGIVLKRNRKVGQVLQADDQLRIVEGRHQADDVCVLFTHQALAFASEIEQKLLQGYDTDSIITSVVPSIHAQHDSSLSAIAFVGEEPAEPAGWPAAPETGGLELTIEVDEEADEKQVETPADPVEDSDNSDRVDELDAHSTPRDAQLAPAQLQSNTLSQTTAASRTNDRAVGAARLRSALKTARAVGSALLANAVQVATRLRSSLRPPFGANSTYVGSVRKPSKLRLVLLVLLVTLVAAGVIAWKIQGFQRRVRAAQQSVAPYYQLITDARATVQTEPLTTRQKVADAVGELEQQAQSAKADRAALPEVEKALASMKAFQEEISGTDELAELPVYYDLRLVSSDFVASRVDGWEESVVGDDGQPLANVGEPQEGQARAVFLDTQQQKVIALDLVSKKVKLFDAQSAGTVKDIRLTQSRVVLLADGLQTFSLTDSNGGDSPAPQVVVEQGDSNRAATLLGAFKVYVYVFNPEKRNIYRYSEQDGGSKYSEPIGWLQSTLGAAFEDISSLAVDGDVWLTTKTGEIRRYTKGVAVPFQVAGLPEPLSTPIQLATAQGSSHLYVLEPAKNRIVVIQKADGVFVREIKSSSLASATALFVSERLKKVFAVSGSIVFEVKL